MDTLRAFVDTCDPTTLAGLRDRALPVLNFALMARRSELTGLDIAGVTQVPEGLLVTIRYGKTDQDAAGADVAVPFGSHPDTCPVRTLLAAYTAGADPLSIARRVRREGHDQRLRNVGLRSRAV